MIKSYEVYNIFLFPWKVPSMNELMFSKGVTGKQSWIPIGKKAKPKSTWVFNEYNAIKQEWSKKVALNVKQQGFKKVEFCYFNYLVVEHNKKRDPSNVFASAVKFIEDGLQEAGVIDNDGWEQVLGIQTYIYLDRNSTGAIMLVMSDTRLTEGEMLYFYGNLQI